MKEESKAEAGAESAALLVIDHTINKHCMTLGNKLRAKNAASSQTSMAKMEKWNEIQ